MEAMLYAQQLQSDANSRCSTTTTTTTVAAVLALTVAVHQVEVIGANTRLSYTDIVASTHAAHVSGVVGATVAVACLYARRFEVSRPTQIVPHCWSG